MTMTYDETYQLTKDPTFRGRVSVACVHYANFIVDEPSTTPAHATRIKWAQNALVAPDVATNMCISTVVNDPKIQDAGGAAVSDPDLQSAVETSINKLL